MTMYSYVDVGAYFGDRDLRTDEDDHLVLRHNTIPNQKMFWLLALTSGIADTVSYAQFIFEIYYYVKFFSPK